MITFERKVPSDTEMSRLVLIKRSYLLAVSHRTDRDDPASRIAAVVLFDFSVEAAIKLALERLGSSNMPRDFPAALQQLDVYLAEANLSPLPTRSSMISVHNLRNASQHQARYPNDTELAECLIYSRDSLRELVTVVWDATFDELSLSQLVRDHYLSKLLGEAEIAFRERRWTDTVAKAAYSISSALEAVELSLFGHLDFEIDRLHQLTPQPELLPALGILANLVESRLFQSSLGLDLNALRRLRSLTGSWVTSGGTEVRYHHISPHLTEADALFAIDTAFGAVLQIEKQVGDLEMPFGYNIFVGDAIYELETRHGIRPESELPEIPQAPHSSFDRATVDSSPSLRHHRAITALRNASAELKIENVTHKELLDVIEQYIIYSDTLASEFGDRDEFTVQRLLLLINFVVAEGERGTA